MTQNIKFKPKVGYVYAVTNTCLKLVNAKGIFNDKLRLCNVTEQDNVTSSQKAEVIKEI